MSSTQNCNFIFYLLLHRTESVINSNSAYKQVFLTILLVANWMSLIDKGLHGLHYIFSIVCLSRKKWANNKHSSPNKPSRTKLKRSINTWSCTLLIYIFEIQIKILEMVNAFVVDKVESNRDLYKIVIQGPLCEISTVYSCCTSLDQEFGSHCMVVVWIKWSP